jgi:PAS domain S-box-containing protein
MSGVEENKFDRRWFRIAFAAVVVAAAFLLMRLLERRVGIGLPPFITFLPAVMIVAMFFGFRAGLFATSLSVLLADYWIFPPVGQMKIARASDAISLVVFACMGIFVSVVAGRYRRYQRRVAALEKERALQESEARFRSVLEDSRDLMYRMNLQTGRFEYISPSVEAVLGYSRDELAQFDRQAMQTLVHPDDLPAVQSAWARLEEAGKEEMEYRHRFKDGNYHWVSNYMALIRDSAGRPLYRDGNIRDITEKKQAVEALRESEAAYRALFENNMDAIFMTIPNGPILAANPAACAMFDMTHQELCQGGRTGRIADSKLSLAEAERALTGKFKGEMTLVRKDGTEFIGEVSSVMLPGETPRSFIIVRDITERRKAEHALIRSEKLASVGRMAATVAHEINNPLAAVTNLLFLVQGIKDLPDPAHHYLDMVDAELNRIAHITRQSLGFYRETDTAAIVSVNAVLESAVDLMKSKIKAKRAVIQKDWDRNAEIVALAGELRQVFSNLIANSLDAIDHGGTIKLRISAAAPDFKSGPRRIRVTVADNGHGIGAGSRKHIFEPFFTTKGAVGTGLGLWVTKQIVDKHSGTIHVRSCTRGARRGTVFSVVLPVGPAKPAKA